MDLAPPRLGRVNFNVSTPVQFLVKMSRLFTVMAGGVLAMLMLVTSAQAAQYLSPIALAPTADGKTMYIACATANKVLEFDIESRKVTGQIELPAAPSGLAMAGNEAFVTCGGAEGWVCIVDRSAKKVAGKIRVGHTPGAPVISPDGKLLFVCNRFNSEVSVIELATKKELRRVGVGREPFAAAITLDGKFLLVANRLPSGRSDVDYVAATVSVIDVAEGKVAKTLQLANGSGSLNSIQVSPDGKYAIVSHILARFHLPASQVDRGWMNANAQTIIDTGRMEIINTVLLDSPESGAANPWGIGWTRDGTRLAIAHAGTHELSVIDFPALIKKLSSMSEQVKAGVDAQYGTIASTKDDVSHDLTYLAELRQRVKLCTADVGPRAVAVIGSNVWAANYFSDTLSVLPLSGDKVESLALGGKLVVDQIRRGEMYYHDARICFQNWQSCSSCHPGDGRADGFNWDLLNDGIGNPKNAKSLLLAHRTPPSMSLAERGNAEAAVRAGIRFVLFTQQPEEVANCIDEYLKSLEPVPSPYLVDGKLSSKAKSGEKVFKKAGCADCHPVGLYTDLQQYDVGTGNKYDQPTDKFDTPTLVEMWRTAPYLHDGSAATVRDVIKSNKRDQHGKTSSLSDSEIDELCAYLLSL